MRKLKRAMVLLAMLGAAWVLVVLTGWLPRPTQAERDGLAALEPEPANARGERNAFALFWLFGYDVPEREFEALLAEDKARYDAELAAGRSLSGFTSVAEGRYAKLAQPSGEDPLLCNAWKADCLARVRAQPDAVRERLAEYSARLQRGDLMAGYDHVHYPFAPRFDSPLAAPTGLHNLQLTAAALALVEGDRDGAFARLCRDSSHWRRLRTRSDSLIVDMIGVAQLTGAIQLYLQMLDGQPADFVPPCPEVFAPLADAEIDQCASLRMEQQVWNNSFPVAFETGLFGDGQWTSSLAWRLVNQPHLVRITAAQIGRYCGETHRERIRARDPQPMPEIPVCGASGWLFDPLGCIVAESGVPAYDAYYRRVLDLDGRLKLLHLALWLRAQGNDPAQAFAARPAELDSPRHGFTLAGGTLSMRNHETGRAERTELTLPMPVAVVPD